MTTTKDALQHGFLTATLSLGLATAARLVYSPLSYASALALVYMGTPAAQDAYEELMAGRTINRAFVETATLTVCLIQGHLLAGSLAFSLYHAGRLLYRCRVQQHQQLSQLVRVQEGDQVVYCPLAKVQVGAHLLLAAGELAPLTGRVVEGRALVNQQPFTAQVKEAILQAGDELPAGSLIVIGNLCVATNQLSARN